MRIFKEKGQTYINVEDLSETLTESISELQKMKPGNNQVLKAHIITRITTLTEINTLLKKIQNNEYTKH